MKIILFLLGLSSLMLVGTHANCEEKKKDRFVFKIKNGEVRTETCRWLARRKSATRICAKNTRRTEEYGSADVVCRKTCGSCGVCYENRNARVFLLTKKNGRKKYSKCKSVAELLGSERFWWVCLIAEGDGTYPPPKSVCPVSCSQPGCARTSSPSTTPPTPFGCFGSTGLKAAVDLWFSDRRRAEDEHGPIGDWLTCGATTLTEIFYNRPDFDMDISGWDTSSVTKFNYAFRTGRDLVTAFAGDVSAWDTARVTSLYGMFMANFAFNGDVSAWDTTAVRTMGSAFYRASRFDGDLSGWGTGLVTAMDSMFNGASSFKGRTLGAWDTGSVETMAYMFRGGQSVFYSFNGAISDWNVALVTDMFFMFNLAASFNQCLEWSLAEGTRTFGMFSGSGGKISTRC